MKHFATCSIALLGLAACHTPVASVTLPSPTTLYGTVSELEEDGFVLTDGSGSIEVEVESEKVDLKTLLSNGDKVTVKGVLDEDESVDKDEVVAEEFDAYSIMPEGKPEVIFVPYR